MHRRLRAAVWMVILVGTAGCLRAADPREAIEGTWEPAKLAGAAAERPTLSYHLEDERLQMRSSAGRSYAATIGGQAAPLEGAPPGTTVSVRKVPAVAYREVVMRDGRPVSVRIVTIADEKVAAVLENRLDGSAGVYVALKR